MKAIVMTCYQSNEERVNFVVEVLKSKGYEVQAYTTSFLHKTKQRRKEYPNGYRVIPTIRYSRNLSIFRLISHKQFASDAFLLSKDYNPDLIWICAPCNSLIKQANKYKKKHKETKIIIDMIDMWPESLPVSINKNLLPFKIWRNIRSKNINCADVLVSECNLYKDILDKEYKKDITTIHWARDSRSKRIKSELNEDEFSLCYVGSINNIIDIDRICEIIKNIDKNVVLHIIGVGEKAEKLVSEAKKVCRVINYGESYDSKLKEEVFSKCYAGLNIYKDNLYIGLTVKSIDYFEYGLPIINNIKGDTWDLIEENNIGVNIKEDNLIDVDKIIKLRKNNKHIYEIYDNNFTKEIFKKKCNEVIDEAVK